MKTRRSAPRFASLAAQQLAAEIAAGPQRPASPATDQAAAQMPALDQPAAGEPAPLLVWTPAGLQYAMLAPAPSQTAQAAAQTPAADQPAPSPAAGIQSAFPLEVAPSQIRRAAYRPQFGQRPR